MTVILKRGMDAQAVVTLKAVFAVTCRIPRISHTLDRALALVYVAMDAALRCKMADRNSVMIRIASMAMDAQRHALWRQDMCALGEHLRHQTHAKSCHLHSMSRVAIRYFLLASQERALGTKMVEQQEHIALDYLVAVELDLRVLA